MCLCISLHVYPPYNFSAPTSRLKNLKARFYTGGHIELLDGEF